MQAARAVDLVLTYRWLINKGREREVPTFNLSAAGYLQVCPVV
jgi:hypothetical protein